MLFILANPIQGCDVRLLVLCCRQKCTLINNNIDILCVRNNR